MQICFFEDPISVGLKPLTLTRPTNDLRIGILKIHEKWLKRLGIEQWTHILPPQMNGVFESPEISEEKSCIWINGRYLPENGIESLIQELNEDEGFTFNSTPVVVRMSGRRSAGLFKAGNVSTADISFEETTLGSLLSQPWNLFNQNSTEIERDIELIKTHSKFEVSKYPGVFVVNPENIFLGKNVKIEPGTVINASEGSVFLGDDSEIMAGSLIRGSFALCEHSVLKMGAKVYGGTTIGPHCKVGGEINNVIFQAYSNKAHDGFLGNSVLGEWCNLGADTNNSNLKNNYSTVRLTDWESAREYDTELQFCGLIMGDHSKTAINSVLNTGTVCGVSSNIFSGKFPPKFIRSFRWIGPENEDIYKFDKAMEASEKMMKRRGISVTPEYRAMMRYLFEKSNT
jgi:UDP-N-acetylglucosamine diphosphorylase/glucosamine-1-phosphate N-acetyltransferase